MNRTVPSERIKAVLEQTVKRSSMRTPEVMYASPAFYRMDSQGTSPYEREVRRKKEAAAKLAADRKTKERLKEEEQEAQAAAGKAQRRALTGRYLRGKVLGPSYFASEGEAPSAYELELARLLAARRYNPIMQIALKKELEFARWAKEHPQLAALLSNVGFASGVVAQMPKIKRQIEAEMQRSYLNDVLRGKAPIYVVGPIKLGSNTAAMERRLADDLGNQLSSTSFQDLIMKKQMLEEMQRAGQQQAAATLAAALQLATSSSSQPQPPPSPQPQGPTQDHRELRRNALKKLLGREE